MSYETVASVSQVTSLLMFIAMFVVVLTYALWPSNGRRFSEAQRRALDLDSDRPQHGKRQTQSLGDDL